MDKKIVLIDTGVLIKLYHGHRQVAERLDKIGYDKFAIASVTIAEIYQGMKNHEKKDTISLLGRFNTIHFNAAISFRFLSLKLRFRERLSIPDAIIAASALVFRLPLYTLNTNDFSYIPGIVLYKF